MIEICETCKIPLNKPYQSVNYSVDNIKNYLYKHKFGKIYESCVETLSKKKLSNYKNFNYLMLNLGKKYSNKYVVWFTSKTNENALNIPNHNVAYNKFNIGLVKLNNNGFVKFNLPINTIYRENGKCYATHIHYLISKNNINQEEPFINRFFTKNILPKYNLSQFKSIINNKSMISLNSLSLYSFNIPNTYYLPTNIAKNYNKNDIDNFMKNVLQNYKKIMNYIENNKISLKEIPIMVFCHNSNCNSAKKLSEILYKNGYVNLHYYPGGWKSYNNINKKKSIRKKKWSKKYKNSINCNRPKGFSQKQFCKKKFSKKRN